MAEDNRIGPSRIRGLTELSANSVKEALNRDRFEKGDSEQAILCR
jgi:hypothetical protein